MPTPTIPKRTRSLGATASAAAGKDSDSRNMDPPANEAPATPAVVCRNSRREKRILLIGSFSVRRLPSEDEAKSERRTASLAVRMERQLTFSPFGRLPHQLSAVRATLGGQRDITQALWAGLGAGRLNYLGAKPGHQGVDRQHDHEVNRRGNDQKRDQGVEEVSVLDGAAMDMQYEKREVRLADDGSNQRVDDIGNQSVDDGRKRGADDDSNG